MIQLGQYLNTLTPQTKTTIIKRQIVTVRGHLVTINNTKKKTIYR